MHQNAFVGGALPGIEVTGVLSALQTPSWIGGTGRRNKTRKDAEKERRDAIALYPTYEIL